MNNKNNMILNRNMNIKINQIILAKSFGNSMIKMIS